MDSNKIKELGASMQESAPVETGAHASLATWNPYLMQSHKGALSAAGPGSHKPWPASAELCCPTTVKLLGCSSHEQVAPADATGTFISIAVGHMPDLAA